MKKYFYAILALAICFMFFPNVLYAQSDPPVGEAESDSLILESASTIKVEAISLVRLATSVENPHKLTPFFRTKLTPQFRSKLTPLIRSKLTPLFLPV